MPHGWLHTGDLATRDADGAYRICGRKKDMFISGGENVFPGEVEAALSECPGVAEAVVVGVPDEKWGEVGRAFVVPRRRRCARRGRRRDVRASQARRLQGAQVRRRRARAAAAGLRQGGPCDVEGDGPGHCFVRLAGTAGRHVREGIDDPDDARLSERRGRRGARHARARESARRDARRARARGADGRDPLRDPARRSGTPPTPCSAPIQRGRSGRERSRSSR